MEAYPRQQPSSLIATLKAQQAHYNAIMCICAEMVWLVQPQRQWSLPACLLLPTQCILRGNRLCSVSTPEINCPQLPSSSFHITVVLQAHNCGTRVANPMLGPLRFALSFVHALPSCLNRSLLISALIWIIKMLFEILNCLFIKSY